MDKSCGIEKKCGACQLSNMTYERQLGFKQAKVVKLLRRFCHVEEIIPMNEPYNYRCKSQYGIRKFKNGRIATGVYQSSTGSVIPTDSCFLNDALSNEIARFIRKTVITLGIEPYTERGRGVLRHILIRCAKATGEYMAVLVCFDDSLKREDELVSAVIKKFPQVKSIVLNVSKSAKMTLGKQERILYGSGTITDILCGCKFEISPRSFYQVNPTQTEILYRTAIEFADIKRGQRILDAYCGIGTIGICASEKAGEIVGVEKNSDAVSDARRNAKLNNIKKARYIDGDAGVYMQSAAKRGERFDSVFTDPPRAGCSREFLQSLTKLSPPKIVYISCAPDTLARDLYYLTKNGYKVRKIQPVDMFPHTSHVECVCLLTNN